MKADGRTVSEKRPIFLTRNRVPLGDQEIFSFESDTILYNYGRVRYNYGRVSVINIFMLSISISM